MIGTLLIMAVLTPDPLRQTPDRWFAEDKLKHFVTSFVVTSLSATGARAAGLDRRPSIAFGAAVGSVSGLYKEVRDARSGAIFSMRDIVWDGAGVGASLFVLHSSR